MSEDSNLFPYRVSLHEEPGDKFQIIFYCMAEDSDHAEAQAEDAYPGCEILISFSVDLDEYPDYKPSVPAGPR